MAKRSLLISKGKKAKTANASRNQATPNEPSRRTFPKVRICWLCLVMAIGSQIFIFVFLLNRMHALDIPELSATFQTLQNEGGSLMKTLEADGEYIMKGLEDEGEYLIHSLTSSTNEAAGSMNLRATKKDTKTGSTKVVAASRVAVEKTIKTAPSFADQKKSLTEQLALEIERIKALSVENSGAQSCRQKDDTITFNGDYCPKDKPVHYINGLPFERFICGQKIAPKLEVELEKPCDAPARMFTEIPNRKGNMKAVDLGWGKSSRGSGAAFPCDVKCNNRGKSGIVATRTVQTIDNSPPWELTFSMEGPLYYGQLKIKDGAFKHNKYWSTTQYTSEVPLPYFSWAEYDIQKPKAVSFKKGIKGASFIARNCNSRNNREQVVKKLSEHFRVDALSSCLHNAAPPHGADLKNKVQTMSFYLFHLAFENQCYEDYITEKLWGPMEAGTIPVYFGSPNAKDHAPNNSIILVQDFKDEAELGAYLTKVANDEKLYEFHQQWRNEPLPPHFHARYDFTEIHSTCRTCRWAYSKFYGLGWNHYNQSLRELATPRYPCISGEGNVLKPFVESWFDSSGAKLSMSFDGHEKCYFEEDQSLTANPLNIERAVRRTVRQQDGAIDMFVESLGNGDGNIRTLRLDLPLPGSDEVSAQEIELGHIRVQNGATRYTILSWPRMGVTLKTNEVGGSVEVPIVADPLFLPLRIRVVVEDVQSLRKGADQEENYFGDLMKRDFFNPVDALTVV